MPHRVPTTIVTGTPIKVEKFEGDMRSPEFQEVLNKTHARYIAALQALWDKHKDVYAPNRIAEMTLVE